MYVATQSSYAFLKERPSFFRYLASFQEKQKECFVQAMDEEELRQRAIQYFDDDTIFLENHELCYENKIRKTMYKIRIEPYHIILSEGEQNPFLPFLQRIYRFYLTFEGSQVEETR